MYFLYQHHKKFQEELALYRAKGSNLRQEIYTSPPSDLPPALVNFLVYERNLSASLIPATLFYLTKRGYYTLEKRTYEKSRFFKDVQEADLAFLRNHQQVMPESPHLQFFINWFYLYENNGCFTLKDIEESVNDRSGALAFKYQFSKWETIVRQEASDLGFHTNICGRQVLTNEYYDEQRKWLAYKEYLLSQLNSSIIDMTPNNIDDALIYAQALEIGSEQLENLSLKLNNCTSYDEGSNNHILYNHNTYHLYPFFFMNQHLWDNINDNVNQNSGSSDSDSSNSFTGGDGNNFGGSSDGGGFSGGGGGDSGAF
jgi:hypothetical protein